MTLKQEIETTIAVYQEACKPENLNFNYCFGYNLEHGICYYLNKTYFFKTNLIEIIEQKICTSFFKYEGDYLCITPIILYNTDIITKSNLLQSHQTRLQFLQNLLNEINQ
jgi:hypothetical protein